jgi:hypothetical protein
MPKGIEVRNVGVSGTAPSRLKWRNAAVHARLNWTDGSRPHPGRFAPGMPILKDPMARLDIEGAIIKTA